MTVSKAAIEVIENSICITASTPRVSTMSWNTASTAPKPN